jgi:TolB-like protein
MSDPTFPETTWKPPKRFRLMKHYSFVSTPSNLGVLPFGERLDSWKEIAAYLKRCERTVRRWEEHECLPVHRLAHDKRSSVYAYRAELDAWWASRKAEIESAEEPALTIALPASIDSQQCKPEGSARSRRPARIRYGVPATVVVLLAIAGGVYWKLRTPHPRHHGAESVAVLPFQNFSPDATNEYFSSGLTAELIAQLMKRGRPRVVGSTSVFEFQGKPRDIRRTGSELGADAIVEGSVRKSGDRLRITAQLVEVSTGLHLWAETYDRQWKDVLAVQEEIADSIVAALDTTWHGTPHRQPNGCSENLEAYELYLRGIHEELTRGADAMTRGLEHFSRAAALEPRCAPVFASLAILRLRRGLYGLELPAVTIPKAKEAARRALAIDESLAAGHAAMGAILALYDWDWPAAEREFKRAIQLNPESAQAHHWYAVFVLALQQRFDEALAEVRIARWLDPASPIFGSDESSILYFAGQYDAAIAQSRRILERHADYGFAYLHMAWAFEQKQMFAEAADSLANAARLMPGNLLPELEIVVLNAMQGRTEAVRQAIRKLEDRSGTCYVPAPTFAHIYSVLGNKEEAFRWLRKAIDERSPMLAYLNVARDYDNLRGDRRFAALLREVGLQR